MRPIPGSRPSSAPRCGRCIRRCRSAQLRDWDGTHLYGYGYGWRLSDVDGQWRVAHTGTLMGMYSSVTLLPDRKIGFVVLINGDGEAARTALTEALTKHYTRPGAGLDVDHYAGLLEQARAKAAANATHPQLPDTSDRKPARRRSSRAGRACIAIRGSAR